MKKGIISLGLASLVLSLSGCTTAVMTYVHTQRVHHGYLVERTRDQVRHCMGQPVSVHHSNGLEVWQYNYRTQTHRTCRIKVFFNQRQVKDSQFMDVGASAHATPACATAKKEIEPCLRRYLMVTK